MFKITMDLTVDGMNHIDDIVVALFQYLAMLKQQDWQKWIFDGE